MIAQVGLIGGIIREELAADRWGTLAKVAELGYKGIEGGAPGDVDLGEYTRRLDDLGLRTITVSAKKDALRDDIQRLIDQSATLEADHILIWWGPADDLDQLRADADLYNTAGAAIAAAGLKFCYHNHDHEFKSQLAGRRAIDWLWELCEPGNVWFEIDVAWVQAGGADPVAFLDERHERIPVIHLKDFLASAERGSFCAVGVGCVDIPAVMHATDRLGIPWAVVEQDRPLHLTGLESITASMLNLRELGLA